MECSDIVAKWIKYCTAVGSNPAMAWLFGENHWTVWNVGLRIEKAIIDIRVFV